MSYVLKNEHGNYLAHGRHGGSTDNIQGARVFSRTCDAKNACPRFWPAETVRVVPVKIEEAAK